MRSALDRLSKLVAELRGPDPNAVKLVCLLTTAETDRPPGRYQTGQTLTIVHEPGTRPELPAGNYKLVAGVAMEAV
jgi:hypothetical protein